MSLSFHSKWIDERLTSFYEKIGVQKYPPPATLQPATLSTRSGCGMAVISLDLSSTFINPFILGDPGADHIGL